MTGTSEDAANPGETLGSRAAEPPLSFPNPRPAAESQDALAWGLAFLPLATALAFVVAWLSGLNTGLVSLATLAAAAAIIVVDRRDLARSGRLPRSASPSTAWCLFPPAYLLRRARRLGTSKVQFWICLACLVLAFAARVAVVVETAAPAEDAGPILPGCMDQSSMQDVISTFDQLQAVKDAGLHGVVVTGQAEISEGPGPNTTLRDCSGKVEASNAQVYDIKYEFELTQGQVIVRVEVP